MEELEIFLIGDQPTTCPYCGARTHFDQFDTETEMYQVHTCLTPECNFLFIAMED